MLMSEAIHQEGRPSQVVPASRRQPVSADGTAAATTLESGDVLLLEEDGFDVSSSERLLFSPAIVGSAKNVGYDPATGWIGGTVVTGESRRTLADMLARFSGYADELVEQLLPSYHGRAERGRTSFRPVEIAGRRTSWRKDDTRLHIDSFPASPVRGRRILRVFANVNPEGRSRSWRIGGGFEAAARRFGPALRLPLPGSDLLLRWLRITKSRRSPYDVLMLQLHDSMKRDAAYQRDSPQTAVDFPAGATWIALTDQVSHAAMSGQYQLEQTFLLPVAAMLDERRSPLRILERLKGRALV